MTNDLDHDLRDTFRRHEQDMLGHGPTPSPSMFRRIRRRQTGTLLMAVVAAAAIAIAGVSGLDAIRSSEQTPAVPGGAETGPAETGPAETAPPPPVQPVPIGTVSRSGAGCALELGAKPIPSGAGTLSVVNETNRRVSFEVYLLSSGSSFSQFEAVVAKAEVMFPYDLEHPNPPGAYLVLVQREVRPSASGTITVNFTTGDAFAVVCLDYHPRPGWAPDHSPFAVVGPIVVS